MAGMVIVGAGECGTRAAFALREAGYEGPVSLIGEEAGFPYERPPLSKPDGEAAMRKEICDAARLAAAGIDYRAGETVTALSAATRTVSLGSGGSLSYERLLLATGAAPRRLTCRGAERARVFRTVEDAKRLYAVAGEGSRVAIIGAGLIGMELAAVLRSRGAQVTVIEAAGRPLGRAVPTQLAERLQVRHVEAGVTFIFDALLDHIADQGVFLKDGRSVPADIVIAAIGVVPNTELAERAGLAIGNGILVDGSLRTSVPEVFAAGDCACLGSGDGHRVRYESWRNAQLQGEHAARSMIGTAGAFTRLPWFWSDQYELGLQVVGLPSDEHGTVRRQLSGDAEVIFFLDGRERLVAAAGLGPGNAVAKDIRLAERLIETGARPGGLLLADPATNLKSLLKQTRAA